MTDTGPPGTRPCTYCDADAATDGSTCHLSIGCPSCEAGPGRPCRRPSGHAAGGTHAERFAVAETLDAEAGVVYEPLAGGSVAGYATGLEIEAAVRATLGLLPPLGERWVGPARLARGLGDVSVIWVRPGRVLHVIGYGPVYDRVRSLLGAGWFVGWSLQPLREGTTPLQGLYEPLRQVCGTRRLYAPLERSGFATIEQIEATPDAGLAQISNIGSWSVRTIRQVVATVLDGDCAGSGVPGDSR